MSLIYMHAYIEWVYYLENSREFHSNVPATYDQDLVGALLQEEGLI